jgi:subtilisin family serine protease
MNNRPERLQPGRRSLWWLVLLLLLLLLWLIMAYLRGIWPFSPSADFPPEAFYMQDQVVVTGLQADVDAAMAALPAGMVALQERLVVDDMLGGQPCPGLPAGGRVIDLYQMGNPDNTVAEVIEAVQNAAGTSGDVTAEPNWLAGAPWEIEGSPWEIEGSPWEIEGSSGSSPAPAALAADYLEQWAWQPQAINLPAGQLPVTGAGIRVGIFDTSPFDAPAPGAPPAAQPINWVGQPTPLSLLVLHPEPAATLPPEESAAADLSNHGLFVAGMVYAVAPGSNIQLIRVLGSDNRGDLFTLNREMVRFISETGQTDAIGTVMNLSLGLRIPPAEAEFGLPDQVQSLRDILAVARCRHIVVVAAAGNNSAGLDSPEPATLPAAWNSVIGVAASNRANGRSCFSNQGDVAAPGGDGQSLTSCVPQLADCQGANCPYALVGPVLMPPAETGYTYWTGSSFATPLVSGLAALVLEMGQGQLTPADVQAIIECGARPGDPNLGSGVVNVRRTLQQCMGLTRGE